MPFKDLREFIAKLVKEREAVQIKDEIDWNLEAGAMLRRAAGASLPAPLFEKIKGYPEGYRIFGGGAANFRRMAIAMDMNPDSHPRELIEEFNRRKNRPIRPALVKEGPCKENVHLGGDVDLFEFPAPMIHDGDGGRYIGTWHTTISKDLNSDWVNWGTYRHMLHNKNTIGILQGTPSKHLWTMFSRGYLPKNQAMEVAIAIGTEPISTYCATTYAPYGVSEVNMAGGLRGEPVELIKCETIGLEVPASAEIIIEGEMKPGDLMDEGPYGEFSGYRTGAKEPRPVIHVKAVTHRNNPILTMSCGGVPVHDDAIMSLTKAAQVSEALKARGLPITGVSLFPETCGLLAAVGIKVPYPHVAEDIAHVIWGMAAGHTIPYVVVVDDDVDPFNVAEVFHALVTKCHPYKGIARFDHSPLTDILPFLNREEQKNRSGGKAYFDCTWPTDWNPESIPQRISFTGAYPPEVQQKVMAIWKKYGY